MALFVFKHRSSITSEQGPVPIDIASDSDDESDLFLGFPTPAQPQKDKSDGETTPKHPTLCKRTGASGAKPMSKKAELMSHCELKRAFIMAKDAYCTTEWQYKMCLRCAKSKWKVMKDALKPIRDQRNAAKSEYTILGNEILNRKRIPSENDCNGIRSNKL